MTTDPTPRELYIQIQNLASQLATVVSSLDDLSRTLAATYVPRGEYNEARKADDRRTGEIEKDLEHQSAFRRQVGAGALVGIMILIANLVVTLTRIPGAGS